MSYLLVHSQACAKIRPAPSGGDWIAKGRSTFATCLEQSRENWCPTILCKQGCFAPWWKYSKFIWKLHTSHLQNMCRETLQPPSVTGDLHLQPRFHRAWVSRSPASGNEQHVAQAFLMDLHLRGWHEDMVTWWIFFWTARNLRQSLQEVAICWPLVERGIVCERICWPLTLQGFQEWLQSSKLLAAPSAEDIIAKSSDEKEARPYSVSCICCFHLVSCPFTTRHPCLWSLLKSSHHEPITSPRPARGIEAAANRWKSSSPWPIGCGGWRFLGQDFTPSKEALQNFGVTLKWRNLTNAAALAESPCRITQGWKWSIENTKVHRIKPSAWGSSSSSLVTNCASQVCAGFNWVLFPVGP